MRMCQHCGAGVPNYAGFCGECGQLVSIGKPPAQEQTLWMSRSSPLPDQVQPTITTEAEDESSQTEIALEDKKTSENPRVGDEDEKTSENPRVGDEDKDKYKQHQSESIDFNLSLLIGAMAEQPTMNVPLVSSIPQRVDAPPIQITDTPTLVEIPLTTIRQLSSGKNVTTAPLVLPDPEKVFTDSLADGSQYLQRSENSSRVVNKLKGKQPSGCMVWLIVGIVAPLLIFGSIIGIGFTILAPTLTLNGSTSVATGDVLHLHGGHFIPGNSVTSVLDGSIPLSYSRLSSPDYRTDILAGMMVSTHEKSAAQQTGKTIKTDAITTITVGSDGTFSVTFVVGQDWKVGQHTIRATEAMSPRSATTTFIVTGNGQTVSNTTNTATATRTATVTSSPTPLVTSGMSAVTPNIITFGPISEGYTQATSTQILLSTTGTGQLNWTARWDKTQAPWLQLSSQAGQVQEPGTQTLIANAVVGNLKAGTYNATILFSSNSNGQGQQSFSLPVSLIIQAGCVKAAPATLNFTGTIGANNPAAQILTLNNCGALGSWTETTTGGSWLLVSPTGGNLNNGASQNVLVSATPANVPSGAGTYQGQITFTNGPSRAVINVIFTVKAPSSPTLGINTTSFSVSRQCQFRQNMWQCSLITLNNNKAAMSNLNWTTTSNATTTIIIKPASGTLQPGQTAAIEIAIPHLICTNLVSIGTVTFSGPANSSIVNVRC